MKCKYCDNESNNEVICDSCGLPFGRETIDSISVEESIRILNKLRTDYVAPVDRMNDEIEKLTRRKKNYYVSVGRHSFMRFYWPAFIIAFIVFFIIALTPLPGIFLLIGPLLVLIGWIFLAKKQEENANRVLYEKEENNRNNINKLQSQISELNSKIDSKTKVLNNLQWLISKKYMNVQAIDYMINELKSGKANSIKDAEKTYSFVHN